jgi:hypothetical protein
MIGVLLLVLSIGTLVGSNAAEWLHEVRQSGAPPTEVLPERFNLITPPAVRATSVAP